MTIHQSPASLSLIIMQQRQRIDISCMPPKVLAAIETLSQYISSSLLTEIHITKQDGNFCIPTSGTSPSPPPDDVRAQQSVNRKIARITAKLAAKRTNRCRKSPEQIGQALRVVLQVKAVPETRKPMTTYKELYIFASNADKNESTYAWHMLGKKLREDEDSTQSLKIREAAVGELFREEFPHERERDIANNLYRARRVFDVTKMLSCNQIMSMKITTEDVRRVTKKDLSKVLSYCK